MRLLRYSINVTLDGCCDHRVILPDEDLHRHAAENLNWTSVRRTSCANSVQLSGDFTQMAKRKEVASKKVSVEPVVGNEVPVVVAVAKPSTPSAKKGKLLPKNKTRLPRRQKKAQQKAAGRL